jgi:hypothetical protein
MASHSTPTTIEGLVTAATNRIISRKRSVPNSDASDPRA